MYKRQQIIQTSKEIRETPTVEKPKWEEEEEEEHQQPTPSGEKQQQAHTAVGLPTYLDDRLSRRKMARYYLTGIDTFTQDLKESCAAYRISRRKYDYVPSSTSFSRVFFFFPSFFLSAFILFSRSV
jgi:hypothetical protein